MCLAGIMRFIPERSPLPVWQRAGLLIKGNRTVYPVPVEDRDMNDRERAKKLLAEGAYTCAICNGEKVYTSHERGVKPLLDLLVQESHR